jgi:DNA-3-methyladenine glycosylase II
LRRAVSEGAAPEYWTRAKRALARQDPVMGAIMRRHPRVHLVSRGDPFQTLARSIVGQQISVKAAQSVWNRVLLAAPAMRAQAILGLELAALRACGLSERKASYIRDLAAHFADGRLQPDSWIPLGDEQVIADLVRVRGIGRWTAEMFLIFNLLRPDVLPLDDIGLQRAVSLAYRRGRAVSGTAIERIARAWRPWRSVATWYLWRSLDPVPVEY